MIDVPGGETNPQVVLKMKQSRFGLGDRRTLDQLIQFSGIDLRNSRVTIDGKNRCGNLRWIPFVEHPKGLFGLWISSYYSTFSIIPLTTHFDDYVILKFRRESHSCV